MDNLLNETKFEEHIASYLANSDLYNKRSSAQFDIEKLCDVEMLEQFLRQQPVAWNKLTKHFPGQEVATVINPDEYDSPLDALMAQMQNYRKMMSHISYFAFTATPKDKTYALYGKDGKSAHDLYSMKQAIDEKFILDVTQNYVSYKTKFELIEKHPDEDKDKLFEQKKALKVIGEWLGKNKYIKLRKASMIVDQFIKFTINRTLY